MHGYVRRSVLGAASVALIALSSDAAVAQGDPATVAESVVTACAGATWADQMAGSGPASIACRLAIDEALPAALAFDEAGQEAVAQALVQIIRDAPVEPNAPAPFPSVVLIFASRLQGLAFDNCQPAAPPGPCAAVVRIIAIVAQAEPENVMAIHVSDLCPVFAPTAAGRTELLAIVDGLAARATAGNDPVMQAPIDGFAAQLAACT